MILSAEQPLVEGNEPMAGTAPESSLQQRPQQDTIETRFGSVVVSRENPIVFSKGLLGFPDKHNFCLAEFPSEKLRQQFKLLQSLDEDSLSFITLPLDIKNSIIAEEDIIAGCKDAEISTESLVTLLIVSVHRTPQQLRLSANARAPLFVDADKRIALQYVFRHDKYQVQHFITL